jgi:hypothetical protein
MEEIYLRWLNWRFGTLYRVASNDHEDVGSSFIEDYSI